MLKADFKAMEPESYPSVRGGLVFKQTQGTWYRSY